MEYIGIIRCLGDFILFVLPCIALLLVLYFFTKIPSFVFRKLLHLVAFTCVTLVILRADFWQSASLTFLIIALAIYPVLALLEKRKWYGKLFVEKRPGEVKLSLLLLFGIMAAIIAVGWGIFDRKALSVAAILMWGNSDAAAALIGIPFGRHKISWKCTDGKKSVEGTLADFIVALICALLIFLLYERMEPGRGILMAVIGALVTAFTELISPSEWDTVTVPSATLAVLLLINF